MMTPDEIFEAIKEEAMNAIMTIDELGGYVDSTEAEPTKEGFEVMLYRGDNIPVHYRVTLADLNAI